MAEVVLFHHAQGLTAGVIALAAKLRDAGHVVHTPDLYGGRTFETLAEGVGYAKEIGFSELTERGIRAVESLSAGLVYAGISLGVVPAQRLAQTRPGALGALFVSACLPSSEFGSTWPASVPLQVHGKDADPEFANEWDLPAARALVYESDNAELFLYPGEEHLFVDSSLNAYDEAAAALFMKRVTEFLDAAAR